MAPSTTWSIRDARPADAPAVAEYNRLLALETEERALDMRLLEPGVRRLFADRALGRYFVAEAAGRVIGQVMVTYEWSDWRNGLLWWLQSVYVATDWRRHGVFRGLYQHVESLARSEPEVCGIRLYMEEHNTRARHTYEALGFTNPGYLVLEKLLRE
jgi:GNAT superfamily N-acetyltransferase